MTTRRFLVPAATAAAVVAIAVGATFVAGRDDGSSAPLGSPTLPALALNAGGQGVAAMTAADSSAESARKIAAPAPGSGLATVTIKGTLPDATDAPVTAYRMERRAATRDDAVKLAEALGVKGEPQQNGAGWVVSDSTRSLFVEPSATLDWRLSPGVVCGLVDGGGSAGSPGSVDGGAPNPGEVKPAAPVAPDTPVSDPAVSTPAMERCAGGAVSSGVACAPPGAQTLVACETPEAKPLPSEDVARNAALELLKKVGIEADPSDARVGEGFDGVRHVTLRRRIEGKAAEGLYAEVGVDAKGGIVSAAGQLAKPVAAGEYPMLPPAELAQQVANMRMYPMVCMQEEGKEGCAPPPPIVVTGATAGLSLVYPADYEKGEAYLLPSWLFTIEGDAQPIAIVAVPKQYLSQTAPDVNVGTIEPAPLPPDVVVDPAPATDGPATSGPAVDLPATTGPAADPAATSPPNPGDAEHIELPTSGWTADQPAMAALLEGTLRLNSDGCLAVEESVLIWPAGYAAKRDGDVVVVTSGDGEVVARSGAKFSAGGGSAGQSPAKAGARPVCNLTEAFTINDAGPYTD